MADITMCKGYGCPKQLECYRVNANVNPYAQSYFVDVPYKDGDCGYFVQDTRKELDK